jgi:hypothetical protein
MFFQEQREQEKLDVELRVLKFVDFEFTHGFVQHFEFLLAFAVCSACKDSGPGIYE